MNYQNKNKNLFPLFFIVTILISGVFFVFLGQTFAANPGDVVIYVSADDGDDESGDGTLENPYQTIQKGIDSVPIGGIVNVAAGEYEIEGVLVDKKNVSIIGPGIGEDVERAYVVANDCASPPDAAFHLHADGITLQGLDIDGDGCEHVVHIGDLSEIQVNGVTVSGNAIHGGNNGATLSWGSSNASTSPNVVSENKIYGNDVGVLIESAFDNIVEKNNIFENENNGIELSLCDGCGLGSPSGNIIRENKITKNEGYGIYSGGGEVVIGDLDIFDNTISENSGGSGIHLNQVGESSDTLNISGNTINTNDSYGIYMGQIDGNSAIIKENTITNNSSSGVYINNVFASSTVTFLDNTISNNSGQGIYVCSEGECSSSTLTFKDNTIKDNEGSGLKVYELFSSTLNVLKNTISGNGGNDSGDENAGFELWYVGIGEGEDVSSTVIVSENIFDGNYYGIYINETDGDSEVTIGEDNVIKNNSNTGIYLGSSVLGVTIIGNTIKNNGVESETTGIVILSASGNEAHENTISGNGSHGVSNEDEENYFDAKQNWWGDMTGPFHDAQNPSGESNAVSDNVEFNPWYVNFGRTIFSSAVSGGDTVSATTSDDISLNSDISGQADLPEGITTLVLNNDANLNLFAGLVNDAVTLQSGDDGESILLTNSDLEDVSVSIPDNTLITGPDGWDGIIHPPVLGTPIGNAPAGFSVGDTIISIGSPDGTLVFDNPVTILLASVTGNVGYRPSGSDTWVQIINICGNTYADPTDPVSPGECYISNGTSTKIVTFHFTSFGSLNSISIPTPDPTPTSDSTPTPNNGGSGEGGGIIFGGGGFFAPTIPPQTEVVVIAPTPTITTISTPAPITIIPSTQTIQTISANSVSESKEKKLAVQDAKQEIPIVREQLDISQSIAPQPLLATVGSVVSPGTNSVVISLLVTIIIFALVGYAFYIVIQRVRKVV